MKKNLGSVDRIIRLLFGLIVAVLYFTGVLQGTLALVLGITAVILAATSFISWCPIYYSLGWSSRKMAQKTKIIA